MLGAGFGAGAGTSFNDILAGSKEVTTADGSTFDPNNRVNLVSDNFNPLEGEWGFTEALYGK